MQNFKDDYDLQVVQDESGKFKNSLEFQLVEDHESKRKWYINIKDLKSEKERFPSLKTFPDKYQTLTFDTKWKYQD